MGFVIGAALLVVVAAIATLLGLRYRSLLPIGPGPLLLIGLVLAELVFGVGLLTSGPSGAPTEGVPALDTLDDGTPTTPVPLPETSPEPESTSRPGPRRAAATSTPAQTLPPPTTPTPVVTPNPDDTPRPEKTEEPTPTPCPSPLPSGVHRRDCP